MNDPATLEEYNEKALANHHVEGFGADVVTWFPCPGCAEADWKGFPITAGLDDYVGVQDPTDCAHCHRTFKLTIKKDDYGVVMHIEHLGGAKLPDYLPPMIPIT